MKILTFVYDLHMGGTQRAAENFALAYAANGHESRVLVLDQQGQRRETLVAAGLQVMKFNSTSLDELDVWAPDMVHLHSHGLSMEAVRALHERTPDSYWVEQNVFSSPTPWDFLVDASFQLSEWCRWLFVQRGGDGNKSFVIPNPVNSTRFYKDVAAGQEFREAHAIPEDALVLGRLGQPQTYKWSPQVIDAFEESSRVHANVWLCLVGAPEEIRRLAHVSAYSERIVVIDSLTGDDALRAYYSALDVFVHSALQGESFGYVLAEAALCEVPIVTLSTPWADNSQGEVVGNKVGGFVTLSTAGFSKAISELLSDVELREAIGSGGRERMLSRYEATELARAAVATRDSGPAPQGRIRTRKDAVREYSCSWEPSKRTSRMLFRAGQYDILACTSGAESWRWLATKKLNALGVARPSFFREK